jgi:hemoglobin
MSLYEKLGGFDSLLAVCRRWHALCLTDALAAHPFSRGLHPQHDERLAAYLAEATGGPRLYSAGYGTESSMQRQHAGNGEHPELDEVCLRFFDDALKECGISPEPAAELSAYFRKATHAQHAYSSKAAKVPDGLPFNHA